MERGHRLVVIIEEEHNPFEMWVMGALFLSCCLFLLGVAPPPTSVEAAVDSDFWRWAWYIQIFIGSLVSILCTFFFKTYAVLRRYLQIFGYIQVASGTFIYAGAVFFYAGLRGTGSGSIIAFVGLACVYRIFSVRRQIRKILDKYTEGAKNDAP